MKKGLLKNRIFVIATLLLAAVCILLPGRVLDYLSKKDVAVMKEVPAEYYAGPSESVILNSSRQLSDVQNLMLVTGVWESQVTTVDQSACRLTGIEAKDLAVSRINALAKKGLYPCSIGEDIKQWYSWDAEAFRAIDTTFQTYAAIFWRVSFVKYDHTEKHTIILTEMGTALYVDVHTENSDLLDDFDPNMNLAYAFLLIDPASIDYLASAYEGTKEYGLMEKNTGKFKIRHIKDDLSHRFNREAALKYAPVPEDFVPDKGVYLDAEDVTETNYSVYMRKNSQNYTTIIQP